MPPTPIRAAPAAVQAGLAQPNGTLYLDEIGDLPLQAALLSTLETGEALRVGASQPSTADVRLLAATSIDLAQAVAAGKLNERLYGYLSEGRLNRPKAAALMRQKSVPVE